MSGKYRYNSYESIVQTRMNVYFLSGILHIVYNNPPSSYTVINSFHNKFQTYISIIIILKKFSYRIDLFSHLYLDRREALG